MSNFGAGWGRAAPLILLAILASAACQPSVRAATPAVSLAGTPSSTQQTAASPPPSSPGTDLHGVGIEVWHPWFEAEASLIDSQVAKFNQENDWGITVRAKGHTGFTELYDDVTETLGGGEGAQLAIAMPEHALAWDAEGSVVDLSPYVTDPAYGLSTEDLKDFPAAFLHQDLVEARRLGLPAQRSAHLLIYNQTWAREMGFRDPPTTPIEFREQACAAHAALSQDDDPANDSRGGWLLRTDAMTYLSWLSAFGGGILDGTGYRFLTPRNLEATVFLKQLYDDGCGWIAPASEDPAADFAARHALFGTAPLEELSGLSRALATADNRDNWTVLGFPGTDQAAMMLYGSSFVMLKSSPEEELATWLFLRWMLEDEQQQEWVEVTGLFPLRAGLQGALADYARTHPQWVAAVALIHQGKELPQLASWRQVRVMMGDGFDAMFRANTAAGRVAEILAIMDRTAGDLSP